MAYPRDECACGRTFGSNVFKQHARKCYDMLKEWAKDPYRGVAVVERLLDERSPEEKARRPIRDPNPT